MENKVFEALGPDGLLAQQVKNFAVRAGQREMAVLIDESLPEQQTIVIEAGTGIGKTFAYLVPALYSGLKVIISTGTKTLQEQLYFKDLPLAKKALKLPARLALLKGRANYLCRERLNSSRHLASKLHPYLVHDIEEVYDWSQRTVTGDIAELNQLSDSSGVWPLVTSTVENCLGLQCSEYDQCFLVNARREAQSADILIINHHLLMADLLLREHGFGELLPGADAFIIDEAHQLPEVASRFFGQSITLRQIQDLIEDADLEIKSRQYAAAQYAAEKQSAGVKSAGAQKRDQSARLLVTIRQQLAEHAALMPRNSGRYLCSSLAKAKQMTDSIVGLIKSLDQLRLWFAEIESPPKQTEQCKIRCENLIERLQLLHKSGFVKSSSTASADNSAEESSQTVAWLERTANGFGWHISPMDIAGEYQQKTRACQCTWIYTSATLAIGDSFKHFNQRLGLEPDQELRLESPFDYQKQAMLYLPESMPEPGSAEYTAAVIDIALSLIKESLGGMFILFTSHRALAQAAEQIGPHLSRPLLVQGNAPRSDLLVRFQEHGNAVLLGTSSFWQGVDVRGQALSCVLIDKLPFASPADPLVQAKMEYCRLQGQNPFMYFQLPDAIITLKQGVGRLIRDFQDAGLLVICDPRLGSKPYGKLFLQSLPAMPRTASIEEASRFLHALPGKSTEVLAENGAG